MSAHRRSIPTILAAALAVLCFGLLAALAPAAAGASGPRLTADVEAPTYIEPGKEVQVLLEVTNVGDAATSGAIAGGADPLVYEIELPPGLTGVYTVTAGGESFAQEDGIGMDWSCPQVAGESTIVCSWVSGRELQPYAQTTMPLILSTVAGPDVEGPLELEVTLSGGGAPAVAAARTMTAGPPTGGFGLTDFDVEARDAAGNPFRQAGGRPFSTTVAMRFRSHMRELLPGFSVLSPLGQARRIDVDLPAGFVGDPSAVAARCTAAELATQWVDDLPKPGFIQLPKCPVESQVGIAAVRTGGTAPIWFKAPIYNVEPPVGSPAAFGMMLQGVVVLMVAELRSDGDYGLTMSVPNASNALPVIYTEVTFWGVPADSRHDRLRAGCHAPFNSGVNGEVCTTSAPRRAFLAYPTDCSTGPLPLAIRIASWPSGAETDGLGAAIDGPTGCAALPFEPSLSVTPRDTRPDAPSGYEIELTVPQNQNPDGVASAHLADATVTFPEGVSVNPASADGLAACSQAQVGLDDRDPASCPQASRIGTVAIETPLLDEPLRGGVYVAAQGDNPFGTLLAVYLVAEGSGVIVKLPGRIDADAETGQLRATFSENPPLPFTKLRVILKDGPRAPLANPAECGTKTVTSELTPYSAYAQHPAERVADPDRVARPAATFAIDCPGVAGFAPLFEAGTVDPSAGVFSPFVLDVRRSDREQYLDRIDVDLPPGLLASLRGVPRCSDAAAEAGRCPAASRVGSADVGAGAGPNPFYLREPGAVYLTGPYRGAPFGLAVVVRAVAGPYDLGTVVVRQAVHVDRSTAAVRVVSDPLPRILEGIPLRLREIAVKVDRDGFTVNPTSCGQEAVRSTLVSTVGSRHAAATRFRTTDCRALPFAPRLGLALKGRRQARTGGHPAVRAVVRQPVGKVAGIRRARVVLPGSLALDPDNANALCEYADGTKPDLENHCPAGSKVGRARVRTPLLDDDLVGDVFFVKNIRRDRETGNEIRTLPMLVVALRGQIDINLVGKASTTRNGRLVSTFAGVPDAPIRRFNLNIRGGNAGILAVTGSRRGDIDLCDRPRGHLANTTMVGHNGKRNRFRTRVKTPCATRTAESRRNR